MPNKDRRAAAIARKGKFQTSGREQVMYRNAKGGTTLAKVLGPGTSSGLKLEIMVGSTGRVIDNVAVATSAKQTNVYFQR